MFCWSCITLNGFMSVYPLIGTSFPLRTSIEMSVLQWVGGLDIMEHCVLSVLHPSAPPGVLPLCNVMVCRSCDHQLCV